MSITTENRPLRIMLVHTSATGSGHASAAASLAQALEKRDDVEVESFDTLSVSDSSVRGTQKGLIQAFNAIPGLPRYTFELALKGNPLIRTITSTLGALKANFSGEALEHIQDFNPDLIISTQAEASAMLNHWKKNGSLEAPLQSVSTDHLGDARWVHDQVEKYYVANPKMVEDLGNSGVPAERVAVTGMPTREEFGRPADGAEMKRELGLDPDTPTLLVSGGGLGSQPYEEIVEALGQRPYPMQVICVCAKNEEAREALEARPPNGSVTVKALGFVDNMSDWVKASDVVVTKPGGLSTSEILAAGKPMVIHNPYPGMEEAQAERLQEMGVAFLAGNPEQLADQVGELFCSDELRASTASKVAAVGRPGASEEIAELAVERARSYRLASR